MAIWNIYAQPGCSHFPGPGSGWPVGACRNHLLSFREIRAKQQTVQCEQHTCVVHGPLLVHAGGD